MRGCLALRSRVSWRQSVALALLLFTFAPFASALVPLLSDPGDSCGMACCKQAKSCCCRKARPHASDSSGPQWQAARGCAKNCRQQAMLPPAVPGIAASARTEGAPARCRQTPQLLARFVFLAEGAAFALFERPPPSIS